MQKVDVHSYCVYLIMQVKKMRVARGASSFITKADTYPILSSITKVSFYYKTSASHISYIERRALG
jgi:hypothetical protein